MASKGRHSNFFRAMLTVIAALLTFTGPTYLLYALQKVGTPYTLSVLAGLACFALGIAIIAYLSKKE